MPDIYTYLDYRRFIADTLEEKRARDPKLSLRKVAKKAGIDAGTFTRLLKGERNISLNIILKIAQALELGKRETNHLITLISYNQSRKESEKRALLADMVLRKKLKIVDASQYEFFQKWYYLAVRELLNFYPFKGDPAELAPRLEPAILPREAKKAVDVLVKTGLVRRGEDGTFRLTEKFVSTGDEWQSMALHDLQAGMIRLALSALENVPKARRDISFLTLSLSPNGFERLKEKLKEFRTSLLELAKEDSGVDGAYQVNLQAFPVTRPLKEEKHA